MVAPTQPIGDEALALLRELAGPDATFREHQLEAVSDLVEDRRRVLCVQRTGWGKSAVYFLATSLLRRRGAGPTVLISPLLALMRNQIDAARRLGIRAVTVNSTNRDDWDRVRDLLAADEVDLLLISPERLNNPQFRERMLPLFIERVGLLVVDEAHCVSDWGHDFRPDYRRIRDVLAALPPDVAVLGTTATANDRVVADVSEQFEVGADPSRLTVYRGPLARASLRLEVVPLPAAGDRLAWLATWLPQMPGSGIVYCLTKRDTELVAEWLETQGISAVAYSGEVTDEDRVEAERRLLANEVKAVVATSALGMGYDKPDLGFVVHFQAPSSAIAYYQQVGRAGRGVAEAHAVLLRGHEDRRIQDFFIESAFPPRDLVERVLELVGQDGAVSIPSLQADVNLGRGRLEAMLKVLDVEGAVRREGSGWTATGEPWEYDAGRYEQVTALRRAEQAAMLAYGEQRALSHADAAGRARRSASGAVRALRRVHRAALRRAGRRRARPPRDRARAQPPRRAVGAQADAADRRRAGPEARPGAAAAGGPGARALRRRRMGRARAGGAARRPLRRRARAGVRRPRRPLASVARTDVGDGDPVAALRRPRPRPRPPSRRGARRAVRRRPRADRRQPAPARDGELRAAGRQRPWAVQGHRPAAGRPRAARRRPALLGLDPGHGRGPAAHEGRRPAAPARPVARGGVAAVAETRPAPYVGMPVQVVYLGRTDESVIEEVRDGGRTLVVDGVAYSLRRLTGEYVADGQPYYGVRVVLDRD